LGRGGFLVGAWIIGKGESCLPSPLTPPSCLPKATWRGKGKVAFSPKGRVRGKLPHR